MSTESREHTSDMPQAELVIAANALPVRLDLEGRTERWETSPGGLVSALAPIARDMQGAWIGWTGEVARERAPFLHDGVLNVPIAISQQEMHGFYEGVCNRTLWPLYHYTVRHPEYHRRWWREYETINRRFTERAAEIVKPGGLVWVHDYHLQLVPTMLRELRPDIRIGFFLHIPFPPSDLFVQIPWRRRILEGLLGADIVGFQTRADAGNFVQVARHLGIAQRDRRALSIDGRRVAVGVYPISIDVDRYVRTAGRPEVLAQAQDFRQRLGRVRKVFLGVDRLDYTKGIDLRLKSFLHFLRTRPQHADGVVFVQVAVPSRERIAEYQELRSVVEELVGQINGQFGEVGTAVVHYLRRTLPYEELVAIYRAADVMVVTPLCDGMNLVAKEYVASRLDGSGALILSEFAGAAAELRSALQVNPHDVDGVAEAMQRALEMPPTELSRRMRAMRRVVQRHTVHDWAARFLGALRAA